MRSGLAGMRALLDTLARRWGRADLWRRHGERRLPSEQYWREPITWNDQAAREDGPFRVFCASMADVFEDHPALPGERDRLWDLIDRTPALTWMLLTKRVENAARMAPWPQWPANVWLGCSVETQRWADARVPVLLDQPAAVRFLSCEPLLAPVDLSRWIQRLDWIIVGGESGARARPMNPEWARLIRDHSVAARVPFFFKQVGGRTPRAGGRELDGRTWDEWPTPRGEPLI